MDLQVPESPRQKGAGMSIWTYLALLLIVGLVVMGAIGFLYFQRNNQQLRLRQEAAEQDAKKARAELQKKDAEETAKITLARNQQEQVLTHVRTATNVLSRLLTGIDQVLLDADALKTNDVGRTIALHPELTQLARRFYESEVTSLPNRGDVVSKLESAKRIEQQLLSAAGTAFVPPSEMETSAESSIGWTTEGQGKLARVRQALLALIQESTVKSSSATLAPDSPTLVSAIDSLSAKEASSRLKASQESTAVANKDAEVEKAKAEAAKIRAEAELQAKTTLAEVNAKKEQIEQALKEKEAELKVQAAKTDVAVKRSEDEATKVLLREKASNPEILAKLTPFTTPGYYQVRSISMDKKPLSYSLLQTTGALSPDARGLRALATIVSSNNDKVRPRWKINPTLFHRYPDQIERLKEAQQLLNELSPVLIEKGLLQP